MKKYTLPELKYDYGALEPHVSGKIMELHHDKHHKGYVDGANNVLAQLAEVREKGDWGRVKALEHLLAFHVSGHVMHSLFWQNLAPKAGGEPDGALAEQLKADFGSFAKFKDQLNNAAMTITGSGWAALAWEPAGKRLVTTQIHDHQSEITQAGIPILVVDAWEHAYYLQYQNVKKSFFDALWNVFNWQDVSARFGSVAKTDLKLDKVCE